MHYKRSEFNITINETSRVPRTYSFNKKYVKSLITFLILVFSFSIAFSFYLMINFKELVSTVKEKEPMIIQELKDEKEVLEQELENIKQENLSLLSKVSSGSSTLADMDILPFFKLPLGFKDIQEKREVKIEQINVEKEIGKIKINFHLLNTSENESRKSGHIFVIMQQGNTFQIYPDNTIDHENGFLKYNFGETFGVSRFRLSQYEFKNLNDSTGTYFTIIIFNRSGDLYLKQVIGPY